MTALTVNSPANKVMRMELLVLHTALAFLNHLPYTVDIA